MKFSVTWNCLIREDRELVTSGSVNTVEAEFAFDGSWAGYDRVAVFKNGEEVREVVLGEEGRCAVPWEVLEKSGFLTVGVYGIREEMRIATIYSAPLPIAPGAGAAPPGREPTPGLYMRLKKSIGDLSALETEGKADLVSAINEVFETGGQGGGAAVRSGDITRVRLLTPSAYHALKEKEPHTLYLLRGEGGTAPAEGETAASRGAATRPPRRKAAKSGAPASRTAATRPSGGKTAGDEPAGGTLLRAFDIRSIRVLDRGEYEALPVRDPATLYFIRG